MVSRVLTPFGLMIALGMCGCGSSGPEKVDVSGTVSYQGEPINDGAIVFEPQEGTNAPTHPVLVSGGKFDASGQNGLIVGKYHVRFHSYKKVFGGDNEGDSVPGMEKNEELLPKKHHEQSKEILDVQSGSDALTLEYKLD